MYNPVQVSSMVKQHQAEMEAYARQQSLLKEARAAVQSNPRREKSKSVEIVLRALGAAIHLIF